MMGSNTHFENEARDNSEKPIEFEKSLNIVINIEQSAAKKYSEDITTFLKLVFWTQNGLFAVYFSFFALQFMINPTSL